MSKYHVKTDGDIGVCRAAVDACPFSAAGAEHFDNLENAALYAEAVIARQEGGSFSSGSLKRSVGRQSIHANDFHLEWSEGKHFGQYAEEGEKFPKLFAHDGRVFETKSWKWDRALLSTTIEAVDMVTRRNKEIVIRQGSESAVTFLDPDEVTLPYGERVRVGHELHEVLKDDGKAEEVVDSFMEGAEPESAYAESSSGVGYYVDLRRIEWEGNTFYGVRTGEIPLEEEDDYRAIFRDIELFKYRSDAGARLNEIINNAHYYK